MKHPDNADTSCEIRRAFGGNSGLIAEKRVEKIRISRKVIGTAGVFTAALFLYPILHECGHLAAARVTGGDVVGFELFSRFCVDLRVQGSEERMLFVGVCGGWFPMLLLCLPDRGIYYLYAVKLAIAAAGVFCAAESIGYGAQYLLGGIADMMDDAVILLRMFDGERETVFLALGIQIAVSAGFLIRTHPLKRTVRFLY